MADASNTASPQGQGGQAAEPATVWVDPPQTPLILLSSVTVILPTTTKEQAKAWRQELEALYTAHYGHSDWQWADGHMLDADAFRELCEIEMSSDRFPIEPDVVCTFEHHDWRVQYLRKLFPDYQGAVDLKDITINDIPPEDRVKWQRAKAIRACDGDLSDEDEIALKADWLKVQRLHKGV